MSSLDADDAFTRHRIVAYDQKHAVRYGHKSAIILRRLEFWFSKKPEGFYKFLEPCQHKLYRAGDSWLEETDLSRRVFMSAFMKIGQRYKSKSAFLNETDPFKGCLYACYYERKTNRMFFVKNNALAERLTQSATISVQQSSELEQEVQKCRKVSAAPDSSPQKCRYRNDKKSRSLTRTRCFYISHKKDITSSLEHTSPMNPHQQRGEHRGAEEMVSIWKKEIGETQLDGISPYVTQLLRTALIKRFDNNLSLWQKYCRLIASSKFLMGEERRAHHFKGVRLDWATRLTTIDRIRSGEFTLGDRLPSQLVREKIDSYQELREQLSGKEINGIEQRLRFALLEKVGGATYKSWFEGVQFELSEGGKAVLRTHSEFRKNHLDVHFGIALTEVSRILGLEICVRI
ncbi:MAG: hypothetical protein ACK5VW_01240 [Holosporales bacterium]